MILLFKAFWKVHRIQQSHESTGTNEEHVSRFPESVESPDLHQYRPSLVVLPASNQTSLEIFSHIHTKAWKQSTMMSETNTFRPSLNFFTPKHAESVAMLPKSSP